MKKQSLRLIIALIMVALMVALLLVLTGDDRKVSSNGIPSGQASGGGKETNTNVYKFAVIAPFTGSNAQYGQAYKRATELLVEQVNNAGGINGSEVVVDYYDDKNDATEAVTIAINLVNDPELLGCVGSQSSTPSMAIAPLFQKAQIPLISPNASHNDFTLEGDYIFRTTYLQSESSSETAQALYDHLHKEIPNLKVGIIYMNTDWGLGFYEYFTERLESLGGEVMIAETYVVNQTQDFTPLLTKIKNAGCNVLVIAPNYSEGAQMVKQARNLGMDMPIVGSSMLYKQEFLNIARNDAEGVYIVSMFYADNPSKAYQDMKKAFAEKYGENSLIDEYVVKSYDALNMLIQGAGVVGHSRAGIRDYVKALKNWPGTLSTITMDENGNPTGPMFTVKVENGKFIFLD